MSPLQGGSRLPVAALCAAIGAGWLGLLLAGRVEIDGQSWFTLFDDAMISLRYARNLADGHGLVWNAGQAPVEGYTNLGWTLVMMLPHALGVPPRLVALAVAVAGLPLLVVCALAARRLAGDPHGSGRAAFCLVLACYALAFWTLRGMEVGALAALVTVAATLLDAAHRRRTLVIFVALQTCAVLVRTDAALLFGVLGLGLVWCARPGTRAPTALAVTGSLALVVVAHTAFRVTYYGDVLPNTFYLKMTNVPLDVRLGRGLRTFVDASLSHLAPLLTLAPIALLGAPNHRPVVVLLACLAAQCGYAIWVGGDAWDALPFANRYFSVVLPIGTALGALGLYRALAWIVATSDSRRRRILRALLLVCACTFAGRSGDALCMRLTQPSEAQALLGPPVVSIAHGIAALALFVLALRGSGVTAVLLIATERNRSATALLAGLVLWWPVSGEGSLRAVLEGPAEAAQDRQSVRVAHELRSSTPPQARIALTRAGTVAYFAGRSTIDLLGRCDPVVARAHPQAPFLPGHDRWDLAHSVETLGADVVVAWQFANLDAMERFFEDRPFERVDGWTWRRLSSP